MHGDARLCDVRKLVRGMNEHGDFFGSDLRGSVSENEKHRIYDVALPAAVGADDGGETLKSTKIKNEAFVDRFPSVASSNAERTL